MRSCLLLLAAIAAPAHGADAVAAEAGDAAHVETSPEIVITGTYSRDRASVLSGTSVLQGAELTRDIRGTIGETLTRQPGVSATSFGPNASRPILRGFQGERVRVLTDGIGSFDVSNTSVDHAVVIDPLLAERIEVLRGPASLAYGSSAIGGVVNVIDKRIPRKVPDEPVHLDLLGSYGSAASERALSGAVDVPVSRHVVVHADASYNKTSDLRIAGSVLSPVVRAEALASDNPDVRALAALQGRLPNSAAETWTAAAGAALIDAGGSLGFAVSHYDSLYGVPARYDLTTGEGEEVRLKVKQNRLDIRGEVATDGFIEAVKLRFGFADYRHSEIDQTGAIGTTFYNKGFEGRLELDQGHRGAWHGASGVQLFSRAFDVVGDEAFLPRNDTSQIGLFTLQELDFGAIKAEAAARYEQSHVQADVDDFRGTPVQFDRRYDLLSGSVGASVAVASGWRLGLNLSHTERAPAAEELLANGPHAGTQAYEIGDPTLAKEKANGVELVLRGRGKGYSLEASAYYTRFSDYIYEAQTGAVIDGLPVFAERQGDARHLGFEVQGDVTLATFGLWSLRADALADYVDAKLLDGGGPVPRIPPLRMLGGLTLDSDRATGRIEVEHAFAQDRLAPFETRTDSFTLVNASVSVQPFTDRPGTSIVLSANNIFDVDSRRHASFLKDFAPLPGRDIRLSLRFTL